MKSLFLRSIFFVFLVASNCFAQISAVQLKDSESHKSLSSFLVDINGMKALVGEILSDLSNTTETHLKMKLLNTSDPRSKGKEVKIPKSDIKSNAPILIVNDKETLESLSVEYETRLKIIEKLTKAKSTLKKPSPEWQRNMFAIVSQKESLSTWLDVNLFKSLALKIQKELALDKKSLSEFMQEWEQSSVSQINTQIQNPLALNEANHAITQDKVSFSIVESPHFRIVFPETINSVENSRVLTKEEASSLLELAERALGYFRREVVLRNLTSDIVDPFSDKGIFVEYFFTPAGENNTFYREFLVKYYKQNWGDSEEEKIKLSGTRFGKPSTKQGVETYYVYSKLALGADLKGKVLHSLGHIFSNVFYNNNRFENPPQPWLEEAVAYWLSFELAGNNSETCVSFDKKRYASNTGKSHNLEITKGFRNLLNLLAKENKRTPDALMGLKLIDLEDSDIAKSFFFYSYILSNHGKNGELWLKESCNPRLRTRKVFNDPGAVLLDANGEFRANTEALLGPSFSGFKPGVDIYKLLNDDLLKFIK